LNYASGKDLPVAMSWSLIPGTYEMEILLRGSIRVESMGGDECLIDPYWPAVLSGLAY